ncbi:MAG: PD-(D/E)XK nuclease family protein [Peptococcaceae bacterium]|nr:PD-(D/E)XK nuclease family protein [Peptococcaceae bacterium]
MKDMMVRALLEAAHIQAKRQIVVREVEREVPTSSGGRIDIVVNTDEELIGIENKISLLSRMT